jgi:hypothetical protein
MCPNRNRQSAICPGIEGTVHPKDTLCDFVRVYSDEQGKLVLVSRGLGERFMSFKRKEGAMGMHRMVSKKLPERETFDEAQEDLNKYAIAKKWQCRESR